VNKHSQAFRWWLASILQDVTQQLARLAPLVSLKAEQDRRLVRKVLVERSHAHARPFRHAGSGEPGGSFGPQNLNSCVKRIIRDLAASGRHAVIISTHGSPFPGLCNRAVLLAEDRVVRQWNARQLAGASCLSGTFEADVMEALKATTAEIVE
jgi:hypothetical protein